MDDAGVVPGLGARELRFAFEQHEAGARPAAQQLAGHGEAEDPASLDDQGILGIALEFEDAGP